MSSPGDRTSSAVQSVIERPVATLMVFLAAVVFGWVSYERLPVTLMPELSYPTLTIRTEYPGAAPEEVENDISRPIEEQVGVIGGLARLSSISRSGVSDVVLEFSWDTEMSDATQAVLEKLDLVLLPEEAKRPLILHYDPSLDPVIELSLSGPGERFAGEAGLRRLRRLAELRIKREIEPIKGVAAARVRGGLEEEIQVSLDEAALRRSGISIQQVIERLAQENINVAGGTLKEGRTEYLVRTLNEYESVEQVDETIIATLDGRDVRLRDLGEVTLSHKEREIVTRADGESVQIEIYKEGDANIVDLARRIKALLGEPGKLKLPGAKEGLAATIEREEGARLAILADRSTFIQASIDEVFDTAWQGGLLAVLVLYPFLLSIPQTTILAVGIPISLLVTFGPLNLMGTTLNIMSLGGLALGIGMLLDVSIVVLESIQRCREEGDDLIRSTIRGTAEVQGPVWSTTLTTIVVFFPMVFVEGVAGQAFGDLGLAVTIALLASTIVALYLVPMLVNHVGLGLGVIAATLGGLMLSKLVSSQPMVAGILILSVVLFFLAGFFHVLLRRLRGRLEIDAVGRQATGLWRWAAREKLRESRDAPGALRRRLEGRAAERKLPQGRFRRLLGELRTAGIRLSTWLFWLYLWVRFGVGTFFEWGIGKPVLLAFLGTVALASRAFGPGGRLINVVTWPLVKGVRGSIDALTAAYPRIIRSALAHPWGMMLLVLGSLWATWAVGRSLNSELLPEVHQGEFTVEVALPVGTPLEETERVLEPVERAILAEKKNIRSLVFTLGYDSENSQRSDEGEHTARFKVLLDSEGQSASVEDAVVRRLRAKFEGIPDLEARVVRPVLFSFKTPIEVEVQGDDLYRLRQQADRAAAVMAVLPELADVESSLQTGAPEVQVVYDRDRLSRYGLNVRDVAELVRSKVKGFEATKFNAKDRRIPIIVRLRLDDRETVDDLRSLIVNPGGALPIRLSAVADITLGEGPSEVRRLDGQRVAVIGANLASGSLSAASDRIDAALHRMEWPEDMSFQIGGQNSEWERSRKSLWIALALSSFLVYVIMAAQFESLLHPLVIMLTIPLAFAGVVVTLKVLGLNLSVMVFLGMILLAGIVVDNAMLLVDYINVLRSRGLPRDEAVVSAGAVRLRPILMTAATTVLGLVPMALGFGQGAEIRTPLAITVISGMVFSTALTLVVIPSVYVLVDEAKLKLSSRGAAPIGAGGFPAHAAGQPDPEAAP